MFECRNPYIQGLAARPCGRCGPCLINVRRLWTHRLLLEKSLWSDNAFVNLTYSDEHMARLPNGTPTLDLTHHQKFLKRLRASIAPTRIRFFVAGEYGEKTWRPHLHYALFNFPTCARGRTLRKLESRSRPLWNECCDTCRLVGTTWGYGDVDLGRLETGSAQYVCGYVTKKMTRNDDPRLAGRDPEFSRKSLKPGLGAWAMDELASEYLRLGLETMQGDVPVTLQHGRRHMPLGRYLRQQLRKKIGRSPEALGNGITEEMLALYLATQKDSRQPSYKKALVEAGTQTVLNKQARAEIFTKRKEL